MYMLLLLTATNPSNWKKLAHHNVLTANTEQQYIIKHKILSSYQSRSTPQQYSILNQHNKTLLQQVKIIQNEGETTVVTISSSQQKQTFTIVNDISPINQSSISNRKSDR